MARLDLFSGVIALHEPPNLAGPRSGEFAMEQRTCYEENDRERADHKYTGQ